MLLVAMSALQSGPGISMGCGNWGVGGNLGRRELEDPGWTARLG